MKKGKSVLYILLLVFMIVFGMMIGFMLGDNQPQQEDKHPSFSEESIEPQESSSEEDVEESSEESLEASTEESTEEASSESSEESTAESSEASAEPSKEPEPTPSPEPTQDPEKVPVDEQKSIYTAESVNWAEKFTLPLHDEILKYNASSTALAPYIAGWMQIPDGVRYTEYMIDFKAQYLPAATYCCLGNWKMDYSSLKQQYTNVRTEYESVQGYAGFQSLGDEQKVSIMSFWDVFCTDKDGKETVIRAKLVYPEATENDSFGGEGTGAHCIVPYEWSPENWYRMHLICTKWPEGNTIVEQWVTDLSTGERTLLCGYDTGVEDACFIGSTAIFLENFMAASSGEVRTMEVTNVKYKEEASGEWKDVRSAYLMPNGGAPKYVGTYNFGAEGDRFWMITSGVGGDWYGNPSSSKGGTFQVSQN